MTVGSQDEATSSTQRQPRDVHLVGSVPLGDAEAVFRTANAILGVRLRRIPDGETIPALLRMHREVAAPVEEQ
jgi:hypothetical protein